MPLHLGNKEVDQVFLGTKELSQIYLGTKEIWTNVKTEDLGTAKEWDIKKLYPGLYKKLTADNFLVVDSNTAASNFGIRMNPGDSTDYWHIYAHLYKDYNPSTGKLSCYTRIYGNASGTNSVHVIMVTKLDKLILLGTGTKFNVSGYAGYNKFTLENFLVSSTSGTTNYYNSFYAQSYPYSGSGAASANIHKKYNASNGVLECYFRHNQGNTDDVYTWFNFSADLSVTVYLRTEI